jgi:hypothetical protein
MMFGSNGSSYWTPEVSTGQSASNAANGTVTWDDNLEDGFLTNSDVTFDANLSTGVTHLSAGDSSLTFNGQSGGTIGSVRIRAASQTNGSVEWSGVSILFWSGNHVVETVNAGSVFADATQSLTGAAEQVVVVTPGSTSCNRVTVTGSLHMEASADAYLEANSLFGQILIAPA